MSRAANLLKMLEGTNDANAKAKKLAAKYSEMNPKIDLFVDGEHIYSTNFYKTIKDAVAAFKANPKFAKYKDSKVSGKIDHK